MRSLGRCSASRRRARDLARPPLTSPRRRAGQLIASLDADDTFDWDGEADKEEAGSLMKSTLAALNGGGGGGGEEDEDEYEEDEEDEEMAD